MEFEKRKAAALASIGSPDPDKSPKGTLDEPIIPLLKALNRRPSFFTTSSCSGRISVLSTPTATVTKKKAKGGKWVFITHSPADPAALLSLLFPPAESAQPPPESTQSAQPSQPADELVFRFEPLIIAVECKDVFSGQSLVAMAVACGFRESGITSVGKRVIVAIRCSIRMEVPLGHSGRIMVSSEYVEYLVGIANEKMEANKRRTDQFFAALLRNGFQEPGNSVESSQFELVDKEVDQKFNGSVCVEIQNSKAWQDSRRTDDDDDDGDSNSGSLGVPDISLSVNQIVIVGEPLERLYLWGHSACAWCKPKHEKSLVFGGFGGMGRHSRRNDTLLLDPVCGQLETVVVQGTPSPRLGHTSSVIGDLMFVIGGRADPITILNDIWVLDLAQKEWRLLQCTGVKFPPRHRHAAAVVGSKVYVFGGLHNDEISSSLFVLDTRNLEWKEIYMQGEWPCPRHSHSLVAYGSQIFMFGGYDGEKALVDLYSYDVQTCLWKKEMMSGRIPYARFSHVMFVYKNYIGIIGGCPVRQSHQQLSLLDLHSHVWKHVVVDTNGEDLFVRSTACAVGDELVVIGGGAACYAFGTKFSEPVKVNLLALVSLANCFVPTRIKENHVICQEDGATEPKNKCPDYAQNKIEPSSTGCPDLDLEIHGLGVNIEHQMVASPSVLQLERKFAKQGKDVLKRFGWLDLRRKVYSGENGTHIFFPITEKFCAVCQSKQHLLAFKEVSNLNSPYNREGLLLKDLSCSTALNFLMACGATKLADEVVKVRRTPTSPLKVMTEAVASLINHHALPAKILEELPTRWERLGDVVVLPVTSFEDPVWDSMAEELWPIIAKSLGTRRLARQGRIKPTGMRDSTLDILVGDNGWVDHRENGILYSFDATKCMFSWGNLSEKLRMARLDCRDEVIVDLFAGIGYFALPFLVRANAKLVYACEWNSHAVEALQRNLHANSVADRCIILEGDNRVTAPKGVADRVCLGLLPTSEGSWLTAVRALRSKGGVLHVHDNVKDSEEGSWRDHVSKSISDIARSEGYNWEVLVEHVERVKWYAPHIRHLVADVRCRQIEG
ncbi:hypothetical protein RJ639_027039 [Escallonia herrerae]|uniref:SAM-dependent methyltransferase TRM5/TYW2-type domain-containing protein n=1 Tax=Escallonia herrerae TaxID=1293975 RepID=A0AA88XA89_9ASTE|nr:hypothetical protein RJ639_027039 [Escallonia herrerae]